MVKFLTKSKFNMDLLISYCAQGSTVGLGLLQVYLINRYFGISTYGQLSIIMSTAGIFTSLLTARSSEAVTRFFKREELNGNAANAKFVLFIGVTIDLITASALVLLVSVLAGSIAATFLKDRALNFDIIVYSIITFFVFMRDTLTGYMQAKEMFTQINLIRIIESFLKVASLMLLVHMKFDLTLRNLIYGFLAASLISFFYAAAVFLVGYLREFRQVKLVLNRPLLKEYWDFNIRTFISSSLKAGNENIDNLVIGYFIDARTVGIYQILKKILSPIAMFAGPLSMLVYPKLITFYESQQRGRFQKIIVDTSLAIGALTVVYSMLISIFLPQIFRLMGAAFVSDYSVYFFLVMVWNLLILTMWWVRIFSNTVNPNYSLYMNLFATTFQLTVTIMMAKLFGIYGLLSSVVMMNIIILSYWVVKVRGYVTAQIV